MNTQPKLFPTNEWYTINNIESVWRYRHTSPNHIRADNLMLIQFTDGEWRIHLNHEDIASAGSLDEAKALCPMLIKFHGQTNNF